MKNIIQTGASILPSLSILIIGVLFLYGCQTEKPASAASTPSGSQTGQSGKPRQVLVMTAEEQPVTRSIEATGTLAAQDQVALSMKVTGRVAEITVDLGDRVRKGQIIARLDATELKLGVDQAAASLLQARTRLGLPAEGDDQKIDPARSPIVIQANATLNEAKLNRDRAQQLFDQKLIARSELDTTVATFQVAEGRYADAVEEIRNRQAVLAQRQSELALARQRLSDATLRSPIEGAVFERQASAGQYLAAGTPVVQIVRIHPLRLRLPVPERSASAVRIGQQVRLTTEQDPTVHYGKVTRLSPAIDETNRTLLVEAEVANERGLLRPGTFARAELVTQSDQPAIFVPATAVVSFAGLDKVITVVNGKSVENLVTTGRKDSDRIEIAEGLKPGAQVVVRPGNLTGGQVVVIAQR